MISEKISVIVPAYNVGKYIEKTLDSICAQTYTNLEIILVDDGSTDNTLDILKRYQNEDSRIKVIHQENGGVTRARFRGISEATGSWIGFVDGDDYIDPKMYQVLIDNAVKYDADISHCGYVMKFKSGRQIEFHGTGQLIVQDTIKGVSDLLSGKMIEPGLWNKLYSSRIVKKMVDEDRMDYSLRNNEDLLMNYYLFKESKVSVFEDKCLYHYLVRNDSAATSNKNASEDVLRVRRIILLDVVWNEDLKKLAINNYLHQLIKCETQKNKTESRKLELKDFISCYGNYLNFKMKLMAFVAYKNPTVYRVIHNLYIRVRKLDKIYDTNY